MHFLVICCIVIWQSRVALFIYAESLCSCSIRNLPYTIRATINYCRVRVHFSFANVDLNELDIVCAGNWVRRFDGKAMRVLQRERLMPKRVSSERYCPRKKNPTLASLLPSSRLQSNAKHSHVAIVECA